MPALGHYAGRYEAGTAALQVVLGCLAPEQAWNHRCAPIEPAIAGVTVSNAVSLNPLAVHFRIAAGSPRGLYPALLLELLCCALLLRVQRAARTQRDLLHDPEQYVAAYRNPQPGVELLKRPDVIGEQLWGNTQKATV